MAAAVVAAVVVGGLAIAVSGQAPPLDRAEALAGDPDRFGSGREAGDTLAQISALVEEAAVDCRGAGPVSGEGDPAAPSCQARFAFAGWTRVAAAGALRCTAPGRAELRASVVDHLDALADLDADASSDETPPLPALPACASVGRPRA